MKIRQLHDWDVSYDEARKIQVELCSQVVTCNKLPPVRHIAGIDTSAVSASRGRSAAVIFSYPDLKLIEYKTAEAAFNFPYIPGLLSFREIPIILLALEEIEHTPDLIFVDGQGLAHPRKFGIASHLGLILEIATIGCAKSRLCGAYRDVPPGRGSYSHLMQNEEIIGAVLRTKNGVKPVFISIGHLIDLQSCLQWTLNCSTRHRLPEPCRQAHLTCSQI
jgi:deoxyribonuclease V